jgi:hypothetical protein
VRARTAAFAVWYGNGAPASPRHMCSESPDMDEISVIWGPRFWTEIGKEVALRSGLCSQALTAFPPHIRARTNAPVWLDTEDAFGRACRRVVRPRALCRRCRVHHAISAERNGVSIALTPRYPFKICAHLWFSSCRPRCARSGISDANGLQVQCGRVCHRLCTPCWRLAASALLLFLHMYQPGTARDDATYSRKTYGLPNSGHG